MLACAGQVLRGRQALLSVEHGVQRCEGHVRHAGAGRVGAVGARLLGRRLQVGVGRATSSTRSTHTADHAELTVRVDA